MTTSFFESVNTGPTVLGPSWSILACAQCRFELISAMVSSDAFLISPNHVDSFATVRLRITMIRFAALVYLLPVGELSLVEFCL